MSGHKVNRGPCPRPVWRLLALAATLGLAACERGMDDLEAYVERVKERQASEVEPLPEFVPSEPYLYTADNQRDPFQPERPAAEDAVAIAGDDGVRPDLARPTEPLEQYPLDALRMVGTIRQDQQTWALVRTDEGKIHRVRRGNHMGQNYGEIVDVHPNKVEIRELIPDGMGNWVHREASLALD